MPISRSPIRRAVVVAAAVAVAAVAVALPPGPVVAKAARRVRRCRRVAAAVLPRRRRHRRQHAVARGRRSREAADAVSERLQRHGVVHEAALYDDHTAYDLNTGEIKWQVPNGDDPATVDHAGSKRPRDTGGVGRNGMVVTRTGLLFQLGKDGWARAYDVDTGKVLWKEDRGQSIGIPTM